MVDRSTIYSALLRAHKLTWPSTTPSEKLLHSLVNAVMEVIEPGYVAPPYIKTKLEDYMAVVRRIGTLEKQVQSLLTRVQKY